MKRYNIFITARSVVCLFVLIFVVSSVTLAGVGPEWQKLFDGKTLQGWKKLGGEAKYKAVDGKIVGTSLKGTPNTFLCTKRHYGDFILEFEVKVDPRLNSGVQIRSNSYPEYRNGRVHGYQVEIDPSSRAYSGGVYDEARRGWLYDLSENEPARNAFKKEQWNHYRVEAIGDHIKTWINGVQAADLHDSMTQTGFIGLQVHGTSSEEPLKVQWRNIRIKDLGRHRWKPLFEGESLEGWHKLPGGEWKIEDDVIIGRSSREEKNHGLLVTDRLFGDFTARVKFKAVKGNSGFYFRAKEVESNVGVHGFQAEIDAERNVGGLYETGGRGWVVKPEPEDVKKWFNPGEWNQMTVSAHGKRVVVHLNNRKSAEIEEDPGNIEGHLALQLHAGQDMKVMFKDIEILVPATQVRCMELQNKPVVFEADFEQGDIKSWQATDSSAWRIEQARGGKVLSLFKQSEYKPPVRSPRNMILLPGPEVGSFVLELEMNSTTKDYPHRDLCLFFGHQDASHFYYVHIANNADPHSNSIFAVDGKPRVSIADERTTGTKWKDKRHTIRLIRDSVSGEISVYFDDMSEPIMRAVDRRFKSGKIGLGSFDDTGQFDDIRIRGEIAKGKK